MSRLKTVKTLLARTFAAAALGGLAVTNSASAQTIDAKLAPSWEFMQKAMPGVPYELLQAACAEKTLTIYQGSWSDAQDAQIKAFEKRFPCINVERFELLANQLRARFQAESRANTNIADIIQDTDTTVLDKEADSSLLLNYTISNDSAFADSQKRKGYWYPLRIAMIGVAWNTDNVTEEEAKLLTDWKGLADPRWKGRAAIVDSGGWFGLSPVYVLWQLHGESFVEKVGQARPRVYPSANVASASLASGDVAVVFTASETGLLPLYQAGAPIRWALPEPSIGIISGQAVSAKAPHLNAAKLYHEYAFTLEGYQAWQALGGAPARLHYQDQRDVAKEPWYHLPTNLMQLDNSGLPKARELFTKYVVDAK